MATLTIVLPTYNEAQNLPRLIERIAALHLPSYEVLVVDDASPDGTGRLAEDLAHRFPVRVVHRTGIRGLAPSVVDGLALANSPYTLVMDADLSHDPAIIPQLLAALEQGAEVVVGSRFAPGGGMVGWPRWRQWMSRCATWMAQVLFAVPVRDPMSGYFGVRRAFFDRVRPHLRPKGYKILLELLVRGQPQPVTEVGFVFRDREFGKSKVSGTIIRAYLSMLIELRWPGRR